MTIFLSCYALIGAVLAVAGISAVSLPEDKMTTAAKAIVLFVVLVFFAAMLALWPLVLGVYIGRRVI